MIVSHTHRYVFFAVPKTATQAIREQLSTQLQPNDWQQQALYTQEVLPISALAELKHGHISVRQAQQHLPSEVLDTYFRFAFVRHPLDRFVSAVTFLFGEQASFRRNPLLMMKQALQRDRFRQRVLIQPQYQLLQDQAGELGVDFVGRYENLATDFVTVCRRTGLPELPLAPRNTSSRGRFELYLDDALTADLVDFYAEDFERFNYPMP